MPSDGVRIRVPTQGFSFSLTVVDSGQEPNAPALVTSLKARVLTYQVLYNQRLSAHLTGT